MLHLIVWDVFDQSAVFGKFVAQLKGGDAFGELALQSDSKRSATCAAGGSGAELMVISKRDFDRVIKQTNLEYQAQLLQEKMDVLNNMNSQKTAKFQELILSTMLQIPMFKKMSKENVEELSNYFQYLNFSDNTSIYNVNDEVEYVYVITQGTVAISNFENTVIIEKKHRGSIFGFNEIALKPIAVGIDIKRQFNCVALSTVRALVIQKNDFIRKWKDKYNEICENVTFIANFPFLHRPKSLVSQQDQEKIKEKGEDDYVLARELEEQQSYLYDLSILSVLIRKKHYVRGETLCKRGSKLIEFGMISNGSALMYQTLPNTNDNKSTPYITFSRYGVYGLHDICKETIVITSPTFDTITINKEELKIKAPKRIHSNIKRFVKERMIWRHKRNNEIIKLSQRLSDLDIHDKIYSSLKKTSKPAIIKCGKVFGHPMRKPNIPTKKINVNIDAGMLHENDEVMAKGTKKALQRKHHSNKVISPNDPGNFMVAAVPKPKSARKRRPLSSSGRRTEVIYGKWSTTLIKERPSTAGRKRISSAARNNFSNFIARKPLHSSSNPRFVRGRPENLNIHRTVYQKRDTPPSNIVVVKKDRTNKRRPSARIYTGKVPNQIQHMKNVERRKWIKYNRMRADKILTKILNERDQLFQ